MMTPDYKAFLKLKIPKSQNIMGLSRESYELTGCAYEFHQGINREGEVCTGLQGGLIELQIAGQPTEELLAWMFDHAKRFNGEITVLDGRFETLEQLYFEEARCVDLTLCYKAEEKPNTVTRLKIAARQMQIGNAYFEELNR